VKFLFVLIVGFLLSIPLLMVYALNWDRQNQSTEAQSSITQGWGGQQTLAGPSLVIPYQDSESQTTEENGKQVTRVVTVNRELFVAPETADIGTRINPEERKRSIYQAVVYDATVTGKARFVLPKDMARLDIPANALDFGRAEIRFGVSDARGMVGSPRVSLNGSDVALEPGHGTSATAGSGFHAPIDARAIAAGAVGINFNYRIRGSRNLTLVPYAGQTTWRVASSWANPSFQGSFLPEARDVKDSGFNATWQIGNLALGKSLASIGDDSRPPEVKAKSRSYGAEEPTDQTASAQIELIQTVDLYDQVNRATKYGFLFIGFTFVALLLFDVIGGVRISVPGYGLVGTGLVLFFVMLLALAEVVGFTAAYLLASAAMIALITAYCTAILKSRKRALTMGAMLAVLYTVLFVLLSLEAYSLLIGSLLLFAALAGVMYATRNLDWSARRTAQP
jgi:inner membrane protein